ncbi:MAG: TonB-dependent receptor [Bacteroidia bacterium]|nr:TonB-dependent receptor [Bacteroidia bacterium]
MFLRYKLLFFLLALSFSTFAQDGGLKGFIRDEVSGVEVDYATILAKGTERSSNSNTEGYYIINELKAGTYTFIVSSFGYINDTFKFTIKAGEISVKNIYLKPDVKTFEDSKITAVKKRKKEDIEIGNTKIKPAHVFKIPTVGGTPDLVQYLQILPGVVFSGDQGGQLYIRGGSPVMNKIMLDGMTIYNPFHSIGLFSIFDADLMKSADVYSAGFGAEFGGRVSAIVDVKTRDGNRNRLAGNFSASPFVGKISLEGPLKKFIPGRGNSSFIFSLRNSYLDRSSKLFYQYANPENLPYNFNDVYGKVTFNSSNGSNIRLFGFNFRDNVNFTGSTSYAWKQSGLGARFTLIPEGKQSKIDGFVTYSDYNIEQKEVDLRPRSSSISGLNMGVNAQAYNKKDEIKYGFEINGFSTLFNIFNSNSRYITQEQFTTEISGFALYKWVRKRFALETGMRVQYYASLGNTSLEPRVNGKYLINSRLTVKGGVGKYSQNLLSAFSDRDVVNLFYGFLSGPDNLQKNFDGAPVTTRLQLARHAVLGMDYDIGRKKYAEIGIEGFYKSFDQITNINRDKLFDDDGDYSVFDESLKKDFIIEKGNAYGGDIRFKFDNTKRLFIWAVYSLTFVTRTDGVNSYNPHWDRRHNANFVIDYVFDKKNRLSANLRWNFGSGFPFTQTQGFYEKFDFQNGPSTNFLQGNGTLGILYGDVNGGRLPTYHRLDASVRYNFKEKKGSKSWLVLSVTNIYNRANIFYFDRVNYKRVNQLPIMPSISYNLSF